ncbi:MAG: hypothetical protein K8R76_06795 [Candidatus Aegiribacteria sp.]|nr:hypothetical protein [Candidatus Aegiribacteria sp.]
MLLRISLSGKIVEEATGTGSDGSLKEIPDLKGKDISSLFSSWPLTDEFSMVWFSPDLTPLFTAARMDSESSLLVYYLEIEENGISNPAIPFIRVIPDRHLPIVSPGFLCLLGYTPWELSQSELISSLLDNSDQAQGYVTFLDKKGKGHRLVFSRTSNNFGGMDYSFIQQPRGLVFPVEELDRLASMNIQGTDDLLVYLIDVLELEAAVLMVRSVHGYVPVSMVNVEIDTEHLETTSAFESANLQYPVWVDSGGKDSPLGFTGQCLLYPYGNILLVAPWRGNADRLQRRADALMPAVSMRYEQFRATYGEHKLQALLHELDIQLSGLQDTEALGKVLDTAAIGFGASVIAIFGPEESASPIASSRTDSKIRDLLVSDRPLEECFKDTHITVLKDGYILLTAWDDEREIPYSTVDAFGKILRKIDLSLMSIPEDKLPDFSSLQAVLMKDTHVLWQGRSLGISHCYQFYGYSRQCADCPIDHLSATGKKSAKLENHQGFIEEIHPARNGFLVTWTKLPEDKNAGCRSKNQGERFPGGTAVYTSTGEIISWNGWFQEATGIGSDQACEQNAARILDRIDCPSVLSQFRSALAGVFIPEPVEFIWKSMKCFSRIRRIESENLIHHTVLDSNRAGIAVIAPLGPGSMSSSSEPGSLAEYLSTACRREGWEFDISGNTTSDGAPVWFSREVTTDLLSGLLRILAPMCPDRWTGLETGWLDNTPETGTFSFLPGRYHVLRFRLHGLHFTEHSATLEKLSILFQGFGGWLAGSPGEEVLQVALPAARKNEREIDAIIYSPLQAFTELCLDVLSNVSSKNFLYTESAREMAVRQENAGAIICRLDQSNLHYANALTARIPGQPVLVASGLSTGIPSVTTRVTHLQLPVDPDSLFSAIRKVIRG